MKKFALAAAIVALSALPALAQNWSGSHVGGTGGYGTGQSTQTDTGLPPTLIPSFGCGVGGCDGRYNVNGGLGGVTLGRDWQKGMWVYGVETDLSGGSVKGQSNICGANTPTPHACGTNLDALSTFRGRIGVANGNWLFYATGGLAVGHISGFDVLQPSSGSDWRAGWAAGVGIETAINANWSVRLEYLHVDLGSGALFNSAPGLPEVVSFRSELLRVGVNYRFDVPAMAAPSRLYTKAVAPLDPWSGWYAGLNGGYLDGATGIGSSGTRVSAGTFASNTVAMTASVTQQLSAGRSGYLAGAQVGYNTMIAPKILAGWEADIDGVSLRETATGLSRASTVGGFRNDIFSTQITATRSLDYLGTIRAKLGALATPDLLLYGTGGLAYGGVRSSTTVNQTVIIGFGPPNPSQTTTGAFSVPRAGYALGAGGEWMFAPHWSFMAEYLYYDLGSANYGTGRVQWDSGVQLSNGFGIDAVATTSRVRFNGNIARAGINYHF